MLRAAASIVPALLLLTAASCVAPQPTYPPPAYGSAPAGYQGQQQPYQTQSADPEGAQPGYPQGYSTGYPAGYPAGTETYAQDQQYQQQQPYYGQQQYAPQQECKSAYGTTACGYGCVAAYGEVKCATQPGGVCQAAYGQVTCSEPTQPAYGNGYGVAPQQECKSEYGTTVCGYGCVAAYGEVKCASQPGGVCQAAYGQVTCSN